MSIEIFKLQPVGKDYIWGGVRLCREYGKRSDRTPLAETWECSVHPDGQSRVSDGRYKGQTLAAVLKKHPEYIGTNAANGEFPILVKFIDAREDLSVQVHPDDAYAKKHEQQNGKTEMWYVLDAAEGATLIHGFRHKVTPEILKEAIEEGTLDNHLQKVKVKKGDVFYIPAGTVHGGAGGILLAEIQESSNITYRVHDFDRVDRNGKKRELHFEKAIQVMNMEAEENIKQKHHIIEYHPGCSRELLCRCKYFEVERIQMTKAFCFSVSKKSFQLLMCLEGFGQVEVLESGSEPLRFKKGDTLFLSAGEGECSVSGKTTLLKIQC